MAETNNKTKRELFSERMKSKYPDREFADDEELFGQINSDYDDYDNQLAGYKDREGKLTEMFSADPRSASFLMSWKEGGDPVTEFVRRFGTEIKERIDDPEWQEQLAAANKEYVERVAKEKEYEEMYNKNLDESKAMLAEMQKENGLSDEQVDEAFNLLLGIIRDGVLGKFSRETMDMAMKAINHDADVETAAYEGEVRGRNTKIDEKLRKQKQGDGLAQLDGKNNGVQQQRKRQSIFDLARSAM